MTKTKTNEFAGRSELLGRSKRIYREVVLPDGATVRIQNLMEDERSRYEAASLDAKLKPSRDGVRTMRARLIALCVVDGEGNRIFADTDIEAIGRIDGRVTNRLADAIQDHCGLVDTVEEYEARVKNCGETAGDGSPSS